MSGKRRKERREERAADGAEAGEMKPRRGLLMVMSLVLAGWMAALLVMYFTTVKR
jgi:hypothetical protein